jgi:chromosome segregation ATPase
METKTTTLKSEKEFLTRELKRHETQKQNFNSKDRKIMLNEVETQTESDIETSLSIENDTLQSRNESLERSIAELEERLKQEVAPSGGNILTNVACTALFPEEKYFPVGSDHKDQYIALLAEYEIVCKERETIKRDKDIANNEIRKLGAELVETKTTHKQTEDQHKNQVEELKRQLEILSEDVIESGKQRESDKNESHSAYYRIKYENQKLNGLIRDHEQTIKEFKEGMTRKINQLEQQEATITKLKQEIEDNKFLLEQKGIQEKAKESQKNELNTTIVQLRGNIDVSEKKLNIHLSKLKNMQVERDDLKAENDRFKTDLKKFSQLEESYTIRGNAIEDKKIEINKMNKELKQKEIQLNSLQKEVGEVTRKLKNELSLESVNVQNGKTRINELEHKVTQLQNELEDVKRVKKELENRELLVTQEKTNLEHRMEELVNKYEDLSTINGKILEHLFKFYNLLDLIYDNGENNIDMFYVIIMKLRFSSRRHR